MHILNRNDVATGLFIKFDHALEASLLTAHNHVGKEKGEGLVTDDVAGAPDSMTETERLLLPREARLACCGLKIVQQGQFCVLVAGFQRLLEFELNVEIILDDGLAASGDENEMFNAGLDGLVDDILDHRLSTTVSISFGTALVAGRKRVPRPATGNTAFRSF